MILELHFADDVKRGWSGRRKVEVLSIGPKWVRLRKVGKERAVRIRRGTWDRMMQYEANRPTLRQLAAETASPDRAI